MIKWSKRAAKSLKSLPRDQQLRTIRAVENLPAGDVKPLHGKLKGLYRLRVGELRVIFEKVNDGYLIHDIRSRGDAYK